MESASADGEQYILVTPLSQQKKPPCLIVSASVLWGMEGYALREGRALCGVTPEREYFAECSGQTIEERNAGCRAPHICVSLDRPVAVSTGGKKTEGELRELMDRAKAALEKKSELERAIDCAVAWDTIFEPEQGEVCSPVSRIWNNGAWGGYVLFGWDSYFGAMLSMHSAPELSYANLRAIGRQLTERGFIPNFGAANDIKSRDRSEPPVGGLALERIYSAAPDPAAARELFPALLSWNRWWHENRRNPDGTYSWGSTPYAEKYGSRFEAEQGDWQAAAYESGLDNSPMFDGVPYDADTCLMAQADVGLTGLYIKDCEALASLADRLGLPEAAELRARAEEAKTALELLWDGESGMYLNRRTDTGEFNRRTSPTCFYALFSDKVPRERRERILKEHFYNENEYWGDYVLPMTPKNDPAFADQDYWRGRIWAPVNYLVWEALRSAGLDGAARDLAVKSRELFLGEWREKGHVHENYSGIDGGGCSLANSDRFYHWGALLALMAHEEGLQ